MKTRHTKLLLTVLSLTLLIGSVALLAGFDLFEGDIAKRVAKKLELTDEQKEQIGDIKSNTRDNVQKLKNDLRIAQLELKGILMEDDANLTNALKQVEEIGDIRTEIQKARVTGMVEAKRVLEPEQVEKWKEMKGTFKRWNMQERRDKQRARRQQPGMRGERGTIHQRQSRQGEYGMMQRDMPPMQQHQRQRVPGMMEQRHMMGQRGMMMGPQEWHEYKEKQYKEKRDWKEKGEYKKDKAYKEKYDDDDE